MAHDTMAYTHWPHFGIILASVFVASGNELRVHCKICLLDSSCNYSAVLKQDLQHESVVPHHCHHGILHQQQTQQ